MIPHHIPDRLFLQQEFLDKGWKESRYRIGPKGDGVIEVLTISGLSRLRGLLAGLFTFNGQKIRDFWAGKKVVFIPFPKSSDARVQDAATGSIPKPAPTPTPPQPEIPEEPKPTPTQPVPAGADRARLKDEPDLAAPQVKPAEPKPTPTQPVPAGSDRARLKDEPDLPAPQVKRAEPKPTPQPVPAGADRARLKDEPDLAAPQVKPAEPKPTPTPTQPIPQPPETPEESKPVVGKDREKPASDTSSQQEQPKEEEKPSGPHTPTTVSGATLPPRPQQLDIPEKPKPAVDKDQEKSGDTPSQQEQPKEEKKPSGTYTPISSEKERQRQIDLSSFKVPLQKKPRANGKGILIDGAPTLVEKPSGALDQPSQPSSVEQKEPEVEVKQEFEVNEQELQNQKDEEAKLAEQARKLEEEVKLTEQVRKLEEETKLAEKARKEQEEADALKLKEAEEPKLAEKAKPAEEKRRVRKSENVGRRRARKGVHESLRDFRTKAKEKPKIEKQDLKAALVGLFADSETDRLYENFERWEKGERKPEQAGVAGEETEKQRFLRELDEKTERMKREVESEVDNELVAQRTAAEEAKQAEAKRAEIRYGKQKVEDLPLSEELSNLKGGEGGNLTGKDALQVSTIEEPKPEVKLSHSLSLSTFGLEQSGLEEVSKKSTVLDGLHQKIIEMRGEELEIQDGQLHVDSQTYEMAKMLLKLNFPSVDTDREESETYHQILAHILYGSSSEAKNLKFQLVDTSDQIRKNLQQNAAEELVNLFSSESIWIEDKKAEDKKAEDKEAEAEKNWFSALIYAQIFSSAQPNEEQRKSLWAKLQNPVQNRLQFNFVAHEQIDSLIAIILGQKIPDKQKPVEERGWVDVFWNAASRVTNAVSGAVNYLRNINEYEDQEVNKVKSSKYLALFRTFEDPDFSRETLSENDKNLLESLKVIHEAREMAKNLPQEKGYTLDYLNHVRDTFSLVLVQLRNAVAQVETDSSINPRLREYVYKQAFNLYTRNDLTQETANVIDLFTGHDKYQDPGQVKSLDEKLHRQWDNANNAGAKSTTSTLNRWGRSAKDAYDYNFSSIGGGNPPQIMNHLVVNGKGSRPITILGMGSPTVQGMNVFYPTANIDPLFRGYLHYLHDHAHKKHLYISLQNMNNRECYRNNEIMNEQANPQIPDTFYALTLAKNSSFYKGKEGSSPNDCRGFKDKLHQQLFGPNNQGSGSYISPQILAKIPDLDARSKKAINAIADMMGLKEGSQLSAEQKKFFINMYYNMISMTVMTELEVDYVNFTCKDGIDRGMGALGWFLTMYLYLSQQENSTDAFKLLQDTLLTRAYWARKRTINEDHFGRYHEDLSFLLGLNLNGDQRQEFASRIREICPKVERLKLDDFTELEFPEPGVGSTLASMPVNKPISLSSSEGFDFIESDNKKETESSIEEDVSGFEIIEPKSRSLTDSVAVSDEEEIFNPPSNALVDSVVAFKDLDDNVVEHEVKQQKLEESLELFNSCVMTSSSAIAFEEKIPESLDSLRLYPFLEESAAKKKVSELIQCYGAVADEFPHLSDKYKRRIKALCHEIERKLPLEQSDRKRALIRDLILTTVFPPVSGTTPVRILPPQRLLDLLNAVNENPDDLDRILSVVGDRYFDRQTNAYQKLLLLSHLNISDPQALASVEGPLFEAIYNSPKLNEWLVQTLVHVPQTYRQTCVGTSYNMFFQRQCGTIAELIAVMKATIEQAEKNVKACDPKILNQPAYDVNVGQAPTTKAYAEGIISSVKDQCINIEAIALRIAKDKDANPVDMANLARLWNYTMQYLESILDPKNPVIVSTQIMPDFYRLSAVFSAIATGLASLTPNQPNISTRWRHGISSNELSKLQGRFFGLQDMVPLGGEIGVTSIVASLEANETTLGRVWHDLHNAGGGLLSISGQGGSGHMIFVEAVVVNDRKVFNLHDPMSNAVKTYSKKEFRNILKDRDRILCPKA